MADGRGEIPPANVALSSTRPQSQSLRTSTSAPERIAVSSQQSHVDVSVPTPINAAGVRSSCLLPSRADAARRLLRELEFQLRLRVASAVLPSPI